MDRWTALAPILYPAKKRFIAGEQVQEALITAKQLPAPTTPIFNLLGEHSQTILELAKTLQAYQTLAHTCQELKRPFRLSIKPSQIGLYPRHDATLTEQALGAPLRVYDTTKTLVNLAQQTGAAIELDMEEYSTIEDTIKIAEGFRKNVPSTHMLRIAIAARHKRSLADITKLNHANISVRLVKGAYPSSDATPTQNKSELRICYLQCAYALLANGTRPAFGTHDKKLIDAIKDLVKKLNLPQSTIEFQFLHGMRPQLRQELLSQGYHIGIYLPYGAEWRAYGLRRWKFFLRNPMELYQYLYC